MLRLKGITWNHTRGYLPMIATAQRFSEIDRDVEIKWEKRSLQEFGDCPLDKLAEGFDLLVIDHPLAGSAAARRILLPLDESLPETFLRDQSQHRVGKSHETYFYAGHQWALAIDAAAPVSSFRRDLLEQAGVSVPQTWEELLELARRGMVALPATAVDSLMNFYMLCSSLGEDPFRSDERVVSEETGVRALGMLRELMLLCPAECFSWNPIATYEALSSGDVLAYCPFAFGYANYARRGYSRNLLEFGGLVSCDDFGRCRSTLGGAGLAISARCQHKEKALEYARWVASPGCQRTLYFESGGQPGHRLAWLDPDVNQASHNFFRNTLETLDRAYLRPRYDGYIEFQNHAGPIVHDFLRRGGDAPKVLRRLGALYQQSLKGVSKN